MTIPSTAVFQHFFLVMFSGTMYHHRLLLKQQWRKSSPCADLLRFHCCVCYFQERTLMQLRRLTDYGVLLKLTVKACSDWLSEKHIAEHNSFDIFAQLCKDEIFVWMASLLWGVSQVWLQTRVGIVDFCARKDLGSLIPSAATVLERVMSLQVVIKSKC